MSRRLPVYLLVDTSGSMRGEPLEALKAGLQTLVSSLRRNPYALETVWLSLISFDREIRVLRPLGELEHFELPELVAPDSGPTHLGAALELLHERVQSEVSRSTAEQRGDFMPLLFVFTDGAPSDLALYREWIPRIQALGFGLVVACAAGPKARAHLLRELTDQVLLLETLDAAGLLSFFRWVSQSIDAGQRSVSAASAPALPPPPPEVQVVI